MNVQRLIPIVVVGVLVGSSSAVQAIGLRGGAGAGGLGGGSGIGGGGNFNRGGGMSRPSAPNLGGGGGGMTRPSPGMSRPSPGASISRPMPNPGLSRPSISQPPSMTRPSLPSGGLKPSSRPSVTMPGNVGRPAPGVGTTRPGLGGSAPNLGGSYPGVTLPGRPETGLTRPGGGLTRPTPGQTLPGGGLTRPGIGDRPITTLPSRPGAGDRPITTLPGRPGTGPGGRPTPGDVGDFLGMQRPVTRPADFTRPPLTADNRPGVGNRLPNVGEGRPGAGGTVRPGIADNRYDFGQRPNWLNRPTAGNSVINSRPSWVNIDRSTTININNQWNNAFVRPVNPGWWTRPADRISFWHGWGNGVRRNWSYFHVSHNWFTGSWWTSHPHAMCGWHYQWRWGLYPPGYWWRVPAWPALTTWFVWSAAPAPVWQQPVFYDYGTGGNVTFQNNYVYVGGERVASRDEFAQSAGLLATVAPPATEDEAQAAEWMPLGTFVVTTSEQDVDPTRTVQLAVSRDGIISGTLYNAATDEAQAIQGRVDKETQRVAIRIGENESLVVETGLYNLTQDEVPLLVHFGSERTENWLLVRLEASEDGASP